MSCCQVARPSSRNFLIHDEGPSGGSTRVKVLGLDHIIFSRCGPRRAGSMNLALESSTGDALNF